MPTSRNNQRYVNSASNSLASTIVGLVSCTQQMLMYSEMTEQGIATNVYDFCVKLAIPKEIFTQVIKGLRDCGYEIEGINSSAFKVLPTSNRNAYVEVWACDDIPVTRTPTPGAVPRPTRRGPTVQIADTPSPSITDYFGQSSRWSISEANVNGQLVPATPQDRQNLAQQGAVSGTPNQTTAQDSQSPSREPTPVEP